MAAPRRLRDATPGLGVAPIDDVPPKPRRSRPAAKPKSLPGSDPTALAEQIAEEHGELAQIPFPPPPEDGAFDPIYNALVVQFMAVGKTLPAFAARAGVSRETIYLWGQEHPEFVDAVRVGKLQCQSWWEDQLRDVAQHGTHTSGRVTAIQFALKNLAKDDWADTMRHEVSGPGGMPVQLQAYDLSRLSTEELLQLENLTAKLARKGDSEGAG